MRVRWITPRLLQPIGLAGLVATAAVALSPAPASLASAAVHGRAGKDPAHAADSTSALALQWYDITNQTVTAAQYPEAVTSSRAWAVSWLAAARAVGYSVDPDYGEAAFVQALHDTLVAQVPSRQSALDADLAATLASIPNGAAKSNGIAAGAHQAAAVLAERANDGLDTASVDIPFTPPPPAPGIWQPTPPAFHPATRAGEGKARPFLLARDDQFDPGPPPSLSSQTYLKALAEVRAYGSATSSVRTPEQTEVALFWYPALNAPFEQVLRAVLADTDRPLAWDASFVAAFHVITTDAQIGTYNAKYEYLFWRPVTAIQDGSVEEDPSWTPLSSTPTYPDWPSGHGGYVGAAQDVLSAFLGPRAPEPISLTSSNDPGVTRTYTDWSTITQEVVNARVWEGVHFRFSDVAGVQLGKEVADYDLPRLGLLGL
ncbi:MAG: phosphoesterase PA-phosphatase [Solirubrobacterales bacterium]|nr:phosphoesterase PA-phosphatase [Solirubrobacterales bacterium]